MAVTIVGTSTPAEHATGALVLSLPAGWRPRDSLYAWVFSRVPSPIVAPGGWTQLFLAAASNRRLAAFYKKATAGETTAAFTCGSGVCVGAITALRSTRGGYEITNVEATAPTYTAAAVQDIGAIGKPTAIGTAPAVGAVVFLGAKIDDWTEAATLSGDSLTWTELVDYPTTTGSDCGLVVDIGTFTSTPTLTNKTFTITGGTAADAVGRSLLLAETYAVWPRGRVARPLSRPLSLPVSRPLGA